MARKRETIRTDSNATPRPDRRSRRRLSVYLNDDGTPDWDAIPDEHKAQLGIGGGGAGPSVEPTEPPPQIAPEMVGFLLDTMTRIEAVVVSGQVKLSVPETLDCLTPAPPLREGLCTAGAAVMNKYSATLGRWHEEIALACLLITWQASAFTEMRKLKAAKPEPEPEPAPPIIETTASATIDASTETAPVVEML